MKTSLRILWRACLQWGENKDSRLGAALAYYTLFSIAPLLLIAIRLAGLIFGADAAQGKVVEHLAEVLGLDTAQAIQALIQEASRPQTGTWATVVGLAVLIIGALGIFLHLRGALCTIWKLQPPHGNSFLGILLDYLLAIVMVLVTGVLLLASLGISTALPVLAEMLEKAMPEVNLPWRYVEMGVSFLFLTLLFAAVYRVLSGQRIAWRYVWYGSAICALLFTVGKTLLGLYLAYSSTISMYGAAGSVVVFLIWVYYSSQIMFFGAELIQARRTRREWLGQAPVAE